MYSIPPAIVIGVDIINEVLKHTPVPFLQPAFTIFDSIWVLIKQTQTCREQLRVLAICTATLLSALDRQYYTRHLTEDSTFYQRRDLHRLLEKLAIFIQRHISHSFLKLLFMKDYSLAMIHSYQSQIMAMVHAFQITALINIRQLQEENELARKADQQSLYSQLKQLAANQLLLKETLDTEKNNTMAMMTTFKRRIDDKKADKEELAFFSQSFRYLMTASGQQDIDIKPWTISSFEVEFKDVIGAGGFGRVYRGSWNQTEVALKVMKNATSVGPRPAAVVREVETWSKLRHPHILQFLGANILDDEPFIVMPMIPNGNICDYIIKNPNCDRLRLIKHIALGLVYLHSQNVIHGDLKGVNILVDDGEKALLCDFGLSRIKADVNSRSTPDGGSILLGSPHWMAPEIFSGEKIRFPCDVYSFAMTMYEIFTNEIPLGHLQPSMLRELVVDQNVRPGRPNKNEAPQLSDEVWNIMQDCWKAEPPQRPTIDVACNKLSNISKIYSPEIPSRSLPMRREALSLEDSEQISCPASPPALKSLQRHATSKTFPLFRTKAPMMMAHYRTSLDLDNPRSVTSIVQSADGKVLIAGLSEGSCIMWNLNVGREIPQDHDIEPLFDTTTAVTFEPSTSTYVAGFNSGQVLYNHRSLSDSPSTLMLTGNDNPILCLHVLNIVVMALPMGPKLAIIKWCLSLRGKSSTSDIVETLPLSGIAPSSCLCAAFSPDGKEIYIGTSGGGLFIYSTRNGKLAHRPFHLSPPYESDALNHRVAECRSLASSPDGKKIVVSYGSGEIRLWDIKARTHSDLRDPGVSRRSDINSSAYSSFPVTFSPDGTYVAYAFAANPTTVNIQEIASKKVAYIDLDDSPTDGIRSLNISPNNKKLVVTFHNSSRIMVCVWD